MSVTIPSWNTPEAGFSKAQLDRMPGFLLWLETSNLPIALKLCTAGVSAQRLHCTAREMRALEVSILDERDSLSAAERDLQILGKAVAWLNRTGAAELPQPKMSHLFQLPRTPFHDGLCGLLRLTRAWIDFQRKWIRAASDRPPVELVILSAVLHGGLWHKSSIVQFARCLGAPEETFQVAGSHVICRLDLPWRGKPAMEKRVWQIDEQTTVLLRPLEEYANASEYRVRDTAVSAAWTEEEIAAQIFKRIRASMRKHGMKRDLIPGSLKQMLDTIALAARSEMPGILVDYAKRSLISHSLKPEPLTRMFSLSSQMPAANLRDASDNEINQEVSALLDLDHNLDSARSNPEEIEPDELRALRAALRTDERTVAAQQLALLPQTCGTNGNDNWLIISLFAVYLLAERHNYRRGNIARHSLAVSTVRAYAMTIGRRLGRLLGSTRLLDLSAQGFEDLYVEVLENACESMNPQRLRRAVALALREFHEYVVRNHSAPAINEAAVLGISHGLLPVDANIISLDEYTEALRIIRWDLHVHYPEVERKLAEAMLILGFRCGTRRMEAFGLLNSDLLDRDRGCPWLLIRPNEQRGLKTANSQRQLPLYVLMPANERALLSELKLEAGGLTSGSDRLLASGQQIVSVDRIIEIVHEGLRGATGDNHLHYHHLRHSFATWTFLRLMLADLDGIPEIFPAHPLTHAWLQESRSFRRALYGHGSPTRKHAFAVASLLGHSGPSTSTEHYVHFMDWMLPLFLEKSSLFSPSSAQIVMASGLPQSTVYSWRRMFDRPREIRRDA